MADAQVMISEAGPRPMTAAAEIETGAPSVLTLAGSVWSHEPDTIIG